MAGYLVLARKYRSLTFEEVVGQDPIAQTLKNAIKSSRIAHAYLFTGTRGVGKTTMARILAKALNCLSYDAPTVAPCNTCDACVAISRGDDIDTIEIDGASHRKLEETQEIIDKVIFAPARSRFKIIYIDEVHMLTRESFNALLKTLEEPPPHVKFIFATTETEKVPATILSRCQRFDFRNIPTRQIAEHLKVICKSEKIKAQDDAIFRIARAGAGSMRDALSLLDQLAAAGAGSLADADVVRVLGTPADEAVLAIVAAVAAGNAAQALGHVNSILEGSVSLASTAAALTDVFRNMMIAKVAGAKSELIELTETQRTTVEELSKKFATPALVQAVGICNSIAYKMRSSSMGRALLEAAIVRLAEADKFVDPASLIERLEALAIGATRPAAAPARPGTAPGAAPSYGSAPACPATDPLKKNIMPDPAAPAAITSAAAPAAFKVSLQWEAGWLAANWKAVTQQLFAAGKQQEAGSIALARVMGFTNNLLTLGFEPPLDALRVRCSGLNKAAIEQALSALAAREITCDFVAAPAPTGNIAGATASSALSALSTAEKAELQKDPAVRDVLKLFGGDVVYMGKESALPSANEPADEGN